MQAAQETLPQQVLSTQVSPDWQSAVLSHGPPLACSPQVNVSPTRVQNLPAAQSCAWVSTVHIFLQPLAAESHWKAPHDCVWLAGHPPWPSHFACLVSVVEPSGHEAVRQTVVVPHLRHLPVPSQKPSLPHVIGSVAAHPPSGSGPPDGIGEQVPGEPANAQLVHTAVQALLQHTPSAQKPLLHSVACVHEAPSPFLPHLPLTQRFDPTHWALSLQES